MPFDPTFPIDNSPMSAPEMRAQFIALKDLCDTQSLQIADLTQRVSDLETELGNVNAALGNCLTQADMEPITANNIDGVTELSLILSDPPLTIELEQILNKLNEVVVGLHR